MACKRGALIVLEGVDKAGKTTQCQKLLQTLQQSGQPVEMMRFPGKAVITVSGSTLTFRVQQDVLSFANVMYVVPWRRQEHHDRTADQRLPAEEERPGGPHGSPAVLCQPLGDGVRLRP